jgi:hypothetical protein
MDVIPSNLGAYLVKDYPDLETGKLLPTWNPKFTGSLKCNSCPLYNKECLRLTNTCLIPKEDILNANCFRAAQVPIRKPIIPVVYALSNVPQLYSHRIPDYYTVPLAA